MAERIIDRTKRLDVAKVVELDSHITVEDLVAVDMHLRRILIMGAISRREEELGRQSVNNPQDSGVTLWSDTNDDKLDAYVRSLGGQVVSLPSAEYAA